jgi:uracil-DNA glycosylase family 4
VSDGGDEVHELASLVGALRQRLAHHRAAGAWASPAAASPRPAASAPAPAGADEAETEDLGSPVGRRRLAGVRAELGECQRCKLHQTRTQIVFGVGAEDAPLVFIGEAPGADEDRTGEPFVGAAGQLLTKMIGAMGWRREAVYIGNVLKCRPPGNRSPEADEVAACQPFLWAQLEALAPRIIVALGRPAANTLLGTDAPISALRGRFHTVRGIAVMPTFHPAFLLRTPERKRDAWSDLQLVMAELERLGLRPPPS